MIVTGIITAPRPKATLTSSLRSFKLAGFGPAIVFAEPGSEEIVDVPHVEYRKSDVRRGNFRNWVYALQSLLTACEHEWLMICEDDIAWAGGAAETLYNELYNFKGNGRAGALSLYLPIRVSNTIEAEHGGKLTRGWYECNLGRNTWGAQCFVLHREWARSLLGNKMFRSFIADPRWDKNIDRLIGEALASKSLSILYRVPCLVDHTFGDGNSSLGYNPDRPKLKTRYFAG